MLWEGRRHMFSIYKPFVNKRKRIPKGQSKTDNSEKLATRQRKAKQKHNTICVGHLCMQTNTNNVNKT